MLPKKRKNAQILLKSQESAQECWKVKIVLQIRKSAHMPILWGSPHVNIMSPFDLITFTQERHNSWGDPSTEAEAGYTASQTGYPCSGSDSCYIKFIERTTNCLWRCLIRSVKTTLGSHCTERFQQKQRVRVESINRQSKSVTSHCLRA